jgi:hypothetical protein
LPTPKSRSVVIEKRRSCLARSPLLKATPEKVSPGPGEGQRGGDRAHRPPLSKLLLGVWAAQREREMGTEQEPYFSCSARKVNTDSEPS